MDYDLNLKSEFLDTLLKKGSPYANLATNGFSLFPKDSALFSLIEKEIENQTDSEKKLYCTFDASQTLTHIQKEIQELEIGFSTKDGFATTEFGQLEDLTQLKSQINTFCEALCKFIELAQNEFIVENHAFRDKVNLLEEIVQNEAIGLISAKLEGSMKEYYQLLDASYIISDMLDIFIGKNQSNNGILEHCEDTLVKEKISEKIEYIDMVLSKLNSLDRYQK